MYLKANAASRLHGLLNTLLYFQNNVDVAFQDDSKKELRGAVAKDLMASIQSIGKADDAEIDGRMNVGFSSVAACIKEHCELFLIKTYEELNLYKVDLARDPVEVGMKDLNEKVANIREFCNRALTLYVRGLRISRAVKALYESIKDEYEEYVGRVPLFDAEFIALASTRKLLAEERKNLAVVKCVLFVGALEVFKNLDSELETFVKIVSLVYNNLRETRNDSYQQIQHIKSMLATGDVASKWNYSAVEAMGQEKLAPEGDVTYK